jgi:spore maturation protein B
VSSADSIAHVFAGAVQWISDLAIPLLIGGILISGALRKVPVFDEFVRGAKDGVATALRILPFLLAMFIAIGVLRSSGALEMAMRAVSPILRIARIPPEVAPLAVIRPISGTASLGYLAELLSQHGPDSLIGRMASTIQGSCDTTLYIVTVYFGAVGVRRVRHAVWVGLLADIVGFIAAVVVCRAVFG